MGKYSSQALTYITSGQTTPPSCVWPWYRQDLLLDLSEGRAQRSASVDSQPGQWRYLSPKNSNGDYFQQIPWGRWHLEPSAWSTSKETLKTIFQSGHWAGLQFSPDQLSLDCWAALNKIVQAASSQPILMFQHYWFFSFSEFLNCCEKLLFKAPTFSTLLSQGLLWQSEINLALVKDS